MPDLPPIPFTVRGFCAEDAAACKALYVDGLIGGKIADNDTGLDIDDIAGAYMASADNHFWVALSAAGKVVGMIGVQQSDAGVGEIRRLRVQQDHRRRGIGKALMEQAIVFCRDRGYIKITLDTFMERDPAIGLFQKFNFLHSRTRKVGEKELLYFYLDLYQREPSNRKE